MYEKKSSYSKMSSNKLTRKNGLVDDNEDNVPAATAAAAADDDKKKNVSQ